MTPASTLATLAALRRGDLAGTRELRLPGLASVPDEVFALADTLEILDLGGGPLDSLPDEMARLTNLRVLFLSGSRVTRLPPVLGACPALSQIGCRGTGLREVPGDALPQDLRWLTLTDNALTRMPAALGERPLLQKLMLAGNRLAALPAGLAGAERLELLRLAANPFEQLPPWLPDLPALAWLSWAGTPFEPPLPIAAAPSVPWSDLALGPKLGEGASGEIFEGAWDPGARPIAVKLFKGAMTSDGLPAAELAATLAAGPHPSLTGAIGRLVGAPEGRSGLVMPLLPPDWRPLAGPPSLASCSRDVYATAFAPDAAAVRRLAVGMAAALAHLHARGLAHGDVYAHNILWDGRTGAAVLGDFGAASALPRAPLGVALQRVETRAFGILLAELLAHCPTPPGDLRTLADACLARDPAARPLAADALRQLGA